MSKAACLAVIPFAALIACSSKKSQPSPQPTEPRTPGSAASADRGAAAHSTAASGSARPTPAVPMVVGEVEGVGLATPESVLYLEDADAFLVSNINGKPAQKDDNGFISKLGADGTIVHLKWIDGASPDVKLDAPKGMAVSNGTLYVADITAVRMFDLATGAAKGAVEIKGATFLNDVAAAGNDIYVTDSGLTGELKPSGTDAIYVIDAKGTPRKLAAGSDLHSPNGITVADGNVWVVPFGGAEVYKITAGKKTDAAPLPAGGLDGLAVLGDGRIIVSSWEAKAVYIGKPGGAFTMMAESVESPADLTVDSKRNRVVVPLFIHDALRFYAIPAP